jgi:hypothetical protein
MICWRKWSVARGVVVGAVCSGLVLVGLIGCGGGGGNGGTPPATGRTVTGTVVNESNTPLAGVRVSVLNSPNVSTQTDSQGRFSLSGVPAGEQILVFQDRDGNTAQVWIEANQTTLTAPVVIVSGFSGPPPPPQF